ncbi:MAG: hypothetical protein P8N76_24040 [Pirellulaceae bacterium]|nr:hypothetical protein [Pirellulaceae bacterium]
MSFAFISARAANTGVLLLLIGLLSSSGHADPVDYESQVKPLLTERCYTCHGALKQEAGLRLDTGTFIRKGGDSGGALNSSDPITSLLIERISSDEPTQRMPPKGDPLTPPQIEMLQDWIGQGAKSPPDEQPQATPPQYQHGDISIPTASEAEPKRTTVSTHLAHQYLEDATVAWSKQHKCISCHTNATYMFVRPALSPTLGKPQETTREFFLSELKTFATTDKTKLDEGVHPAQLIYLAAGLAEWDAHVTKQLSPETEQAIDLMFALQREHGSWGAVDCWPPYESDAYHLATVAAMAISSAPGWETKVTETNNEQMLKNVAQLKSYLQSTPPHDYGRTLLLWSAARMPGLIDDARKTDLIDMLTRHQREDGGWSLRTMAAPEAWGQGNRAEKLRSESNFSNPESDGHMTGLAIIALRESGLPVQDARIQRGITWLQNNQRESGRWWTRSLNTDGPHFITYSGTALPLLALQWCDTQ